MATRWIALPTLVLCLAGAPVAADEAHPTRPVFKRIGRVEAK